MRRLLQSFYDYRALLVFCMLELTSLSFVYYREQHASSSIIVVNRVHSFLDEMRRYFFLRKINAQLLKDNARMKLLLSEYAQRHESYTRHRKGNSLLPAYVVNNSIISTKNYLTLDRGSLHGVVPGMGVMTDEGVVGRVKHVSKHFSTVTSILHTSMQISAKLAEKQVLGTVQWRGGDPFKAQLLYVPRHVEVAVGDVITTSGYHASFLPDVPIGRIHSIVLNKEALFYEIELVLNVDLSKLQYVYIVKNSLKPEKDALEDKTKKFYE